MFLAEVVAVHVDEAYMDKNDTFHLSKAKPLAYSHGRYYGLGECLGTFGYSVRKKPAVSDRVRKDGRTAKTPKTGRAGNGGRTGKNSKNKKPIQMEKAKKQQE